ncbi:MAG: SAM-dependent methyltransferase [Pseudomonadota bacterium]
MSDLSTIIRDEIREAGPMPVARFMALALGHPQHGYYTTGDPLGTDFTTSPEISQMFGELVGAWAADIWHQIGLPVAFTLVELGPGRGTLMADALRAASGQPGFAKAARIQMVETSPVLSRVQQATLAPITAKFEYAEPEWISSVDQLADGPLIIIANEFFDALPVHQFIKTDEGWREQCVVEMEGELAFAPSPTPVPGGVMLAPALKDAPVGTITETCQAGTAIATELCRRIANTSGAALIIDYGYTRSAAGDTLQAMQKGKFVPVLENPGKADITAHVDFEALAACAGEGTTAHPATTQGQFLMQLGIAQRAAMLKRGATPDQAEAIDEAVGRLTDDDAMGTLFKVLAITAGRIDPAGF